MRLLAAVHGLHAELGPLMGQLSRLEGRETCAASRKRVSADCAIVTTGSAENCQKQLRQRAR
jgi:hypothetical protein